MPPRTVIGQLLVFRALPCISVVIIFVCFLRFVVPDFLVAGMLRQVFCFAKKSDPMVAVFDVG